jgi:hypothetical protein
MQGLGLIHKDDDNDDGNLLHPKVTGGARGSVVG